MSYFECSQHNLQPQLNDDHYNASMLEIAASDGLYVASFTCPCCKLFCYNLQSRLTSTEGVEMDGEINKIKYVDYK